MSQHLLYKVLRCSRSWRTSFNFLSSFTVLALIGFPVTYAQTTLPQYVAQGNPLPNSSQASKATDAAADCAYYLRHSDPSLQVQTAHLLAVLDANLSSTGQSSLRPPQETSPCWNDAQFLAQLGHLLVEQHLYLDAVNYLERAVMLHPHLNSAQVDYALALSGSGDVRSGAAMLNQLLQDPTVPVELAPSLMAVKDIFSDGVWRGNGLAGLTIGYDSNLLGAPNLGSLALTVSGQAVLLPLAPSYQAQKGGYSQGDIQYEAQKVDIEGRRYDFYGSVRERYVPINSNANYSQYNLVGEYGHPASWGQGYVNISSGGYDSYFESFYSASGVGTGGIIPLAQNCSLRAGVNGMLRRYNTNTILSGNYLGLQSIVGCPSPFYWQAILNWGVDQPTNSARPGGAQNQTALRVLTILPAGPGQILLDAQATYYQDSIGYSTLIESNRLRSISQYSLKGEYQYALNHSWQLAGGYNWINQISTINLYQFNSAGPYIALRFGW